MDNQVVGYGLKWTCQQIELRRMQYERVRAVIFLSPMNRLTSDELFEKWCAQWKHEVGASRLARQFWQEGKGR